MEVEIEVEVEVEIEIDEQEVVFAHTYPNPSASTKMCQKSDPPALCPKSFLDRSQPTHRGISIAVTSAFIDVSPGLPSPFHQGRPRSDRAQGAW